MKVLKKSMMALAMACVLFSGMISCNHDVPQGGGGNTTNNSDPVQPPKDPENQKDPENSKEVKKEFTEEDFSIDGTEFPSNEWAFKTYSLSEFAEKDVIIDFSADMKVVNKGSASAKLQWQVNNNGSYPEIVSYEFPVGETSVTVAGKNAEPIKIASTALLYLSTYELTVSDLTIDVKNIKYTVSYEDATEPETPEDPVEESKEYTQADFTVDANNPSSSWAYITYSLSEFAGKDVIIDFSADMEVDNRTSDTIHLMWQVNNNGSYPEIAVYDFPVGKTTATVTGKNAKPITIANNALLYLSTNNSKYDMSMDIKNIKYTVTYTSVGGGDKEPELPPREYPTDIFVVAEEKVANFTEANIFDKSQVSDVVVNSDGTIISTSTAAGSGGGLVLYINQDHSVINASNYESIDVEVVISPVTGNWNPKAKNPSLGFRLYGTDATGFWSGFEDIEYFGLENPEAEYGTIIKNIKIDEEWVKNYIDSNDNDDIKAFAFKFNAYETGNDDSDQLRIQVKKVQFNKKEGAPEDKATSDGLTEATRGTVQLIHYPTHDYANLNEDGTTKIDYEKPAYVYLPAGYDPEDKATKYPIFVLMHGFGQNWTTWGLTTEGNGGKIKGYMDRGMASGDVEKFILVVPTGVADSSWSDMSGNSFNGYNVFGPELRDDLIPYMEANFNVRTDRDGRAMAGLSMGGGQTFNIGIGQCLDMFSYFGAFSAATFTGSAEYIANVEAKFPDLKIHQLYMICGDADSMVWSGFQDYVAAMPNWEKVEKFNSEVYPGGTHDFPVWYRGFKHVIPLLFK